MGDAGMVAGSGEEWTPFIQAREPRLPTVYTGEVLATEDRQEASMRQLKLSVVLRIGHWILNLLNFVKFWVETTAWYWSSTPVLSR